MQCDSICTQNWIKSVIWAFVINLQDTENQLASFTMRSSAEKKRHIFAESLIFEKIDEFMTTFVEISRGKTHILSGILVQ